MSRMDSSVEYRYARKERLKIQGRQSKLDSLTSLASSMTCLSSHKLWEGHKLYSRRFKSLNFGVG